MAAASPSPLAFEKRERSESSWMTSVGVQGTVPICHGGMLPELVLTQVTPHRVSRRDKRSTEVWASRQAQAHTSERPTD